MEIREEIKIELLNTNGVSVIFTKHIEYGGQKLQVGEAVRTAYVNSVQGREDLKKQIPKPYLTCILEIWGNMPTVVIPEPKNKKIEVEKANNKSF